MKKRVAIIGSGISGLTSAWLLAPTHEVTLFEAGDSCGGHSHTIDVDFPGEKVSIDTGFMVYNFQGYPELTKFFKHLDIPTQPAEMSFSVSLRDGAFEWSVLTASSVFADRRNMFRVSFYRFLWEIIRFNNLGKRALTDMRNKKASYSQSIDDFLNDHSFSEAFRQQYIYPMASLIWSAPRGVIRNFPMMMVLEFLSKHNLLQTHTGLTWRSVVGGSRTYVDRIVQEITENHGATVLIKTPVFSVLRTAQGVVVHNTRGKETFDSVVFATHADITLQLLIDVTSDEREILQDFAYQKNHVVAHSDTSLMPKRKRAWAAWNFCDVVDGDSLHEMSLTYNMNLLNGIPARCPVFVTINPARPIDEKLVHATFRYDHPLQNLKSVDAQKRIHTIQGHQNTYYCGAYFGYGFHEDGFCAGKEVAEKFGVIPPWEINQPL